MTTDEINRRHRWHIFQELGRKVVTVNHNLPVGVNRSQAEKILIEAERNRQAHERRMTVQWLVQTYCEKCANFLIYGPATADSYDHDKNCPGVGCRYDGIPTPSQMNECFLRKQAQRAGEAA